MTKSPSSQQKFSSVSTQPRLFSIYIYIAGLICETQPYVAILVSHLLLDRNSALFQQKLYLLRKQEKLN